MAESEFPRPVFPWMQGCVCVCEKSQTSEENERFKYWKLELTSKSFPPFEYFHINFPSQCPGTNIVEAIKGPCHEVRRAIPCELWSIHKCFFFCLEFKNVLESFVSGTKAFWNVIRHQKFMSEHIKEYRLRPICTSQFRSSNKSSIQ